MLEGDIKLLCLCFGWPVQRNAPGDKGDFWRGDRLLWSHVCV